MCKGRIRIYTFWNKLHHMHRSWHRYMVILIQTISTNLTVQSVHNSTSELPNKYLLVMKNFRSIHTHKVSLLMCWWKKHCCFGGRIYCLVAFTVPILKVKIEDFLVKWKFGNSHFLDSAYLKYESKLKLPLLPKNALISVF